MLLKNMVGPWGIEPETSTVSSSKVLQQHTRPRGLPKYAEVHIRHTFCGLGCGLEKAGELQNRPTYFPERISIVSWITDIRERIGSVNTSAFLGTDRTEARITSGLPVRKTFQNSGSNSVVA
jgi:hypothetical protein